MGIRTPLKRARGLGPAKEGTHHWWVQRLTAVALIPLTLWLVASLAALAGADHAAVLQWISHPAVTVLLILLLAITFHHGQLGMQVVIEDYVHHEAAKLALVVVVKGLSVVLAVAAIVAVLRISLGANL